jgi:hypothetical protein
VIFIITVLPTRLLACWACMVAFMFCISSKVEKVANWEIYSVLDVGSKGS